MMNQSYYQAPYAQQFPYGMQQQAMPMYPQQPMKTPEYTNPLGAAKIKELLQKGNGGPKIALTEEDYLKAVCTHRFEGSLQLVEIGEGKHRCKICGAEFTPVEEATQEDVKAATENLLNILHTSKVAWLDVPDKVATEFFQAIAVIDKTPELYKIAMNNFQQYNGQAFQNSSNPVNGFGMINQIMGPQMPFGGQQSYMPQPYAPQPVYQQQQPYQAQPQAQYQQQPYQGPQYDPYGGVANYGGYNPAAMQMQAGAPGMSNGFGYPGVPVQPTEPSTNAAQQQSAAQTQSKGETVTKQLHV